MVAKSRSLVRCGYEGCSYEGQRRILKRHTETKHPGCPIKEFPNSIGIKDLISVIKGLSAAKNPDGEVGTSQPEPSTSSSSEDSLSLEAVQEQIKDPNNITSNLGDILSKIITLVHREGLDKKTPSCTTRSSSSSAKEKQPRSMEALIKEKSGLLELAPEEDIVFCKACKKKSAGSAGVFPYNFNLGVKWGAHNRLPTDFLNLRLKIDRHFKSTRHQKNCLKLEESEPVAQYEDPDVATAMKILRTAYHVIKSSQHHEEFYSLIHLQSMNGMQVGDMSYTVPLISKLRDAFYDEIMLGIKSELFSTELSNDLNMLADLTFARSSNSVISTAKAMVEALERLKQKKLVPAHTELTEVCCQNVASTLKEYKPFQYNITNDELFKFAWEKSEDFKLKSYMRLVVRLRLINPYETFVGPLATAIMDTTGDHRHLDPRDAAKELVIKWNGPPLHLAEPLLQNIQKRLNLKFSGPEGQQDADQASVSSQYSAQ